MHLLYNKFGVQSLIPTALTLRDEHYDLFIEALHESHFNM